MGGENFSRKSLHYTGLQLTRGVFLITDWCGWRHPCTGGLEMFKNTGWASHRNQANMQHSCFGSCLQVLVLLEFPPWLPSVMGVLPGAVGLNKPFPLHATFGHGRCQSNRKLSKNTCLHTVLVLSHRVVYENFLPTSRCMYLFLHQIIIKN